MKQSFVILLLHLSLYLFGQGDFSSRFVKQNQRRMDSIKSVLRGYYTSFNSTRPVTRKAIRADKKVIKFLNKFYNEDASLDEIRNWLKPFFNFKWDFQIYDLGHAKKYDTRVKSEGNLDIHVSLATFKDQIVYKRIYFNTKTNTLFDHDNSNSFPPDIKYIDSILIPNIHFPIAFCMNCYWIACDTTYTNKLAAFTVTDFKFFSDSSYLNYMTWFDNDVYKRDYAVRDICDIVKRNDTAVLEKLLYSPNYILAIYAMEALIYMRSTGSYSPSIVTSEKMNQIKNADITIRWQTSDVVREGFPYRKLGVIDEFIIYKFKAQLLHK